MANYIGNYVWTPEGLRAERVLILSRADGLPDGWFRCRCDDGQINAIHETNLYLTRPAALRAA